MDDIAYLITESAPTYDEYGNEIMTRVESQVFVQERSVTRSEFYTAAQVGLHPSIVLRISHRLDYEGQKLVKFHDVIYEVTRTYSSPGEDWIELTLEEKNGTE